MASLFGIAPDKAFPASPVTKASGGLLHHHFTLARHKKAAVSQRQPKKERAGRFVSVELALHRCSFPLGSIPPCGVRTFLCTREGYSGHLVFPWVWKQFKRDSDIVKGKTQILPKYIFEVKLWFLFV